MSLIYGHKRKIQSFRFCLKDRCGYSFGRNVQKFIITIYAILESDIYLVFAHSGQISLPGGKFEPGDRDLIATAVREAKEEVGIKPSTVKIIGTLTPLYIPRTRIIVFL